MSKNPEFYIFSYIIATIGRNQAYFVVENRVLYRMVGSTNSGITSFIIYRVIQERFLKKNLIMHKKKTII